MPPLDQRQFLFVTGKGGSGKTTVAAALALALAQSGRRVLVTVSGARERLSEVLGSAKLTTNIELLRPNLWGVLLQSNAALREYGTMVLRSQTLVDALFGNKYVEGFFNGAPGLKEWALLGKAWYHSTEALPDGSRRFDVVVFDAPATGHGLDMLRVPQVILAVAPPGRLRTDAERAYASFRDASVSGVVVVTLPEEMPTNETLELVHALQNELRLPIARVIANSSLEPLFSDVESQALEPFATGLTTTATQAALAAAARRALAERTQAQSLARLSATGLPLSRLPRMRAGVSGPQATELLSRLLLREGL
ncbi:MAG TPA: ArsA-related P-loop ATPase [Polyangiaceae bacterium]|nr:ArsA-related P-loop ATPase [Polyangiaceae bacterium]